MSSSDDRDGFVYDHPLLGRLMGVQLPNGSLQFRNVRYASIPARWEASNIINNLSELSVDGGPFDARHWGPMAPQAGDSIDFDFHLIQQTIPVDRTLQCDEEGCLNLVLTMPSSDAKDLPVVVFIHGGGFFVGSNTWPQYDLAKLVDLSVGIIKKPVIGVGINYRLGLLGLMASKRITKGPAAGNFAYDDQANALRWIQRHISGFGGDPSNVTVFGESAGAISTWLHLLRGEPLFQRAMIMSGDPRLRPPLPIERNELVYDELLKEIDMSEAPSADQERAVRSMPWERLLRSKLNTRNFPTLDGGYCRIRNDSDGLRSQIGSALKWCKTLVLSDLSFDAKATAFTGSLKKPELLQKFRVTFREFFDESDVENIIRFYGLDQPELPTDPVHMGLMQFVTDVRFYMPIVLAQDASDPRWNLYVCHIHEPNPFEGPYNSRATHVPDVAYTLQTYQHLLPPESRVVSQWMGTYLLDLAHGAFDDAVSGSIERDCHNSVRVYGEHHDILQVSREEYDESFRRGAGTLIKGLGVERCIQALGVVPVWTAMTSLHKLARQDNMHSQSVETDIWLRFDCIYNFTVRMRVKVGLWQNI